MQRAPHECDSIDWNGRHVIEFQGCGGRFANQLHDALSLPKPTNDTFVVGYSSGCASSTTLCAINRTQYLSDCAQALDSAHDFPSLATSLLDAIQKNDFDEHCLQNHFACLVTPKYDFWKMGAYWASGKQGFLTPPCWKRPHNKDDLMRILRESTAFPMLLDSVDGFIDGGLTTALEGAIQYEEASITDTYSGCSNESPGTILFDALVPSSFRTQMAKAKHVLHEFLNDADVRPPDVPSEATLVPTRKGIRDVDDLERAQLSDGLTYDLTRSNDTHVLLRLPICTIVCGDSPSKNVYQYIAHRSPHTFTLKMSPDCSCTTYASKWVVVNGKGWVGGGWRGTNALGERRAPLIQKLFRGLFRLFPIGWPQFFEDRDLIF